ncbi:MAG: NADPH-dependent FMN reductase [Solirubrobacterales bacterium]
MVAIGGSQRSGSSTAACVEVALEPLREAGFAVVHFDGEALERLPFYPDGVGEAPVAEELVEAVRVADAVLVASPGYHGSLSGLVKNGLDYLEELREDERPYLSGRPVGCIATGAGWQAAVATLGALRAVVHALRGWPTPLGAAVNTVEIEADPEARARAEAQLCALGGQVLEFVARPRLVEPS